MTLKKKWGGLAAKLSAYNTVFKREDRTLGRVEKIKNAPILMRHESKVAF